MPHPVRCVGCEPKRAKENVVRTPIGDKVTKHSKTLLTAFLHDVFQGEEISPDMVMCDKCYEMADHKDLLLVKEALRRKRSDEAAKKPPIRRGGMRGRGARGRAGKAGRPAAGKPKDDDDDGEDSLYQVGDTVPARPRKTKGYRRGRAANRGGGGIKVVQQSPLAHTLQDSVSHNDSFNTPPLLSESNEQQHIAPSLGIIIESPDSTNCNKKRISSDCEMANKKFKEDFSEETAEIIIKRELDDIHHIETTISYDVSSGRSSPLESIAMNPELSAVSIEVIKTEISDNEDEEKMELSSPVKTLDDAALNTSTARAVHVISADSVTDVSIDPRMNHEEQIVNANHLSPQPDTESSICDLLSSAGSSQDPDSRSVSPSIDSGNDSPVNIKVEDCDAEVPSDVISEAAGQTMIHQCCSQTFESAKEKQDHYLKVHMKKKGVQCPFCPFIAPSDPCVEGHLRNVHGKTPKHHCPYCPRGFFLLASLTHHRQNIHRKKVPPVKRKKKGKHICPTCGDFLLNRQLLRLHNLEKHGREKFQCQYCSFETKSNLSLIRHDATVHQKQNFLNHFCSTCRMSFLDPKLLEDHCINVHQLERTYFCKKCGDRFACSNMLNLHEKMHMPYKCMRCGIGFKKRENWLAHMKTFHNHDNTGVTLSSTSAENEPMVTAVPGAAEDDTLSRSSNNLIRGSSSLNSTGKSLNNLQSVSSYAGASTKKSLAARAMVVQEYDKDVAEQFIRNFKDKVHNNKITCIFCLKEVTSAHLRIHFKKHAGDASHACPYCDKRCIQSTNLRKHIRNKHPGEAIPSNSNVGKSKKGPVLCEFCDHIAENCDLLEEHLWEHMEEKTIECELCNVKFGMESNYKEHMKKHYFSSRTPCPHCTRRSFSSMGFFHEHIEICKRNWECKNCNEVCGTEAAYRKHRRSAHPDETTEKYSCLYLGCGRVFYERHRYDDHQITHGEEKRFECPHCSKKFKRKRPLDDHIVTKHTSISCANCNKVFASLQDLVNHRNEAHLKDFYRCDVCALIFWTKKTLKNHKFTLHPSDDTFRLVFCDKCPEVLPSGLTLKKHWQHHTASLMCSVHQCYEACEGTEALTKHMSFHASINYTCVYCQVEFSSESDLTEHWESSHVSPMTCDVCQDKVYSEKYFEEHASTHNNIKKYTCTLCSLYFPDRFMLVAHLKSFHDVCNVTECPILELVLGCSLCDFLCYSYEDIAAHLLTHGEEKAEKLYKMHEKKLSDTIVDSLEATPETILVDAEETDQRLSAAEEACTTDEQMVESSLLGGESALLQTQQGQVQYLMLQKDEDGNLIVAVHGGDDNDVTDGKAVMRTLTNGDALSVDSSHKEGKQLVLKVEGNEEGEQQLMVCSEGVGGGGRLVIAKGDNGELVLTKEEECFVQSVEGQGGAGENLLLGNSASEQLELLLGDALRNRTLSTEGLGDQLTALLSTDGQIIISQD